ncbi:SPOR domain-containing protein [Hydrogenophaga sp.]|uniref:SPOR domain-containing protein n=1 Tax=Hydrogenophaga sp. TaxID=1904254 RepID=UPI0035B18EB7
MNISFPQAHGQRGGTLVGFVVGLLVGLGLALSVAVYVTRVPVPFVDRGVTRKPADDAAEAERNKNWNPNAGLVNKQPPLPAPPPVQAAPDAAPAGAADAAKEAKPVDPAKPDAAKPVDNAGAKAGSDPLGDLVKAKTGGAEPAPAPGADPFTYFVQVGAFKSAEEAQAQKARLAMLGMEASVTEREQSGRTVFRVRMGPFNQKNVAEATRSQLESNGVEAALVRVQR